MLAGLSLRPHGMGVVPHYGLQSRRFDCQPQNTDGDTGLRQGLH